MEHGLRVGDAVTTNKFDYEGVVVSFGDEDIVKVKLIGIDALISFLPTGLIKIEDERECARILAVIAFDL